ncbi:uncharacterized protein LOC131629754 [Vicia villosa]|uniref:uncharacterized protein LOC131629754 n=1 Tax=Vicia villosa TaxID=3911 RepID=UPI00273AFC48|nr:uncharacterized protein LOC131629754 [Vicia villosa]
MSNYKWELGMYFTFKRNIKDAVISYAIQNGRNLKFIKNDKTRLRVRCKDGCQWELYCAKLPDEDSWQGMLPAMDDLLLNVEQRFCVRHLYNNFRKRFPSKMLKEVTWKAGKCNRSTENSSQQSQEERLQGCVLHSNGNRFSELRQDFYAESTKEAWDILVKYYEGGEKFKVVKLQTLCRQYELLSMREDEKVVEYVSKVQKLVHLMKGCGETLTDKMIVEKVMRTLNSHFDHVIVAIQESNKVEDLKLEDLVGLLEAHEIRIVERKGVHDSIRALQSQSWKKNGGSNKFKGKFKKNQGKKPWSNPHKQKDEDRTSESSNVGGGNYRKDKEDKNGKGVQFYKCEKWGHMSKCYWYKKHNGSTTGKDE